MHLTLCLGEHYENLQLQGHAYVNVDGRRIPINFMSPEERILIHEGSERVSFEYWGINGSLGYDFIAAPAANLGNLEENKVHPAHVRGSWRSNSAAKPQHVESNTALSQTGRSHGAARTGSQGNSNGRSGAGAANPWAVETEPAALPRKMRKGFSALSDIGCP